MKLTVKDDEDLAMSKMEDCFEFDVGLKYKLQLNYMCVSTLTMHNKQDTFTSRRNSCIISSCFHDRDTTPNKLVYVGFI